MEFINTETNPLETEMNPVETELLKISKSLGRTIHYGKYMIESQIDLAGKFLNIW